MFLSRTAQSIDIQVNFSTATHCRLKGRNRSLFDEGSDYIRAPCFFSLSGWGWENGVIVEPAVGWGWDGGGGGGGE